MQSIHSEIVRYLQQQRELYGNSLHVEAWTGPELAAINQEVEVPRKAKEVSTGTYASPANAQEWMECNSLKDLQEKICNCLLCELGATRTSFVFGSGNPNAKLMILGEAPGAEEDAQGLPFVGRAGQLLTKILEAIEISRDDVFICNILKCRPPNNRKPLTSETDTCEPYLKKQIDLIKPKYILALGLTAANTLLKNKESMSTLRAGMHSYHGIATKVTYHPAALLRNPAWKKETWEDVKELKSKMDLEN